MRNPVLTEEEMTPPEMLDKANLAQFTGTENWYRHGLNRNILYTDGAKYVADNGGAYWLLDLIVAHQHEPTIRAQEFQVWKLAVNQDRTATIACEDGNGNEVHRHLIEFTDFPLPDMELWFQNNTILLPSEY
jgi:hypothetical protein